MTDRVLLLCRFLPSFLLLFLLPWPVLAESPRDEGQQIHLILHGSMSPELPTEDYLRFVERVRPDVLITGVFDQRLYATAAPSGKKPAADPRGLLMRWKAVAGRLQKKGIRLVGQMELNALTDRPADRKEGTGWFGFYAKHWDERLLGKRPARSASDLLEQPDLGPKGPRPAKKSVPQGDAFALCGCRVNTRALNACVNNPAWRETQKRMVRAAIDIGVAGFITNRNYTGHCGCEHCRTGFRLWLSRHYTPQQLRERFKIKDLESHPLTCVVGAHREIDRVPDALVREKIRFSKQSVKDFLDEVYIDHGRRLRKDLFVAQWNHLAFFDELHLDRGHLPPSTRTTFAHAAADERWGLPTDRWGKGESLFWYCNWGTTQNTILAKEYAGDTVLYGKYVRAMARGKPYVINKYDFYRPRNVIAEAAALGYTPNAIATPWQNEADRAVVISYFDFLRRHQKYYHRAESHTEVGLVLPRRALHAGDASPLEYVEAAGRAMVREHVLFDILPDDLLPETALGRYRVVVLTSPEYLEANERAVLARYVAKGGKLLLLPVNKADRERPGAAGADLLRRAGREFRIPAKALSSARTDRAGLIRAIRETAGELGRFDAPWTVETHVYRQETEHRLVLHLVNYNHDEKAKGRSVSEREAPIAAAPVGVSLRLPQGFRVRKVRFFSPDENREKTLEFRQKGNVLDLKTPAFLVYGLCVMEG
jgi:hypothetical protein